jgi:hypothetical protein
MRQAAINTQKPETAPLLWLGRDHQDLQSDLCLVLWPVADPDGYCLAVRDDVAKVRLPRCKTQCVEWLLGSWLLEATYGALPRQDDLTIFDLRRNFERDPAVNSLPAVNGIVSERV